MNDIKHRSSWITNKYYFDIGVCICVTILEYRDIDAVSSPQDKGPWDCILMLTIIFFVLRLGHFLISVYRIKRNSSLHMSPPTIKFTKVEKMDAEFLVDDPALDDTTEKGEKVEL